MIKRSGTAYVVAEKLFIFLIEFCVVGISGICLFKFFYVGMENLGNKGSAESAIKAIFIHGKERVGQYCFHCLIISCSYKKNATGKNVSNGID